MRKIVPSCFIIFCISCSEKLDERIIKNSEIEISWYRESEISSSHDFIDVLKDDESMQIVKANEPRIVDVFIKHDTILIKTEPSLIIYEIKNKAFNYTVIVDSTATHGEWIESMKKKNLWH